MSDHNNTIKPEDSLIEYPCHFPIKVMGKSTPEFKPKVLEIGLKHDSSLNAEQISERASKNNKYISLTLNVWAVDRKQLDALYEELTSCEMILWVL